MDARIAPSADGRVSWTRSDTLHEAAIVAAEPEAAAAREHAAARETFAKATRSTEHGMRGFYIRADFATITRIDATIAYLAQVLLTLGDTTSLDHRCAEAVLIMANPTQGRADPARPPHLATPTRHQHAHQRQREQSGRR